MQRGERQQRLKERDEVANVFTKTGTRKPTHPFPLRHLRFKAIFNFFLNCHSNTSCGGFNVIFTVMFLDGQIVQNAQLRSDKIRCIINWGLRPYFENC